MPASEVVDGKLDAGRTAAVVATEARDVDEPHDAIARPAKPATAAVPHPGRIHPDRAAMVPTTARTPRQ